MWVRKCAAMRWLCLLRRMPPSRQWEFARAEPRGLIKASCPVQLAQTAMAQFLPAFLARYPNIRLVLHATNRRVDVLNEGFDLALRVRTIPTGEDGLVMRTFGQFAPPTRRQWCVPRTTRPPGAARATRTARNALLCAGDRSSQLGSAGFQWHSGAIEHSPRLVCHDFPLLRAAVLGGLGIALLPESVVRADIDSGQLEQVLPAWTLPLGIFHVVFPTRRGLLPSVRAFIDFLAQRMPGQL